MAGTSMRIDDAIEAMVRDRVGDAKAAKWLERTEEVGEVDDDGGIGGNGLYPSTADDHFELKLIDCVEKNPCIYNRCHPLHKMSDYKSHVWSQIAIQLAFPGPGIELERKWRHMRDRYVRLRKINRTSAPLKKGDKWFLYFKKMSFLDPYVEHRNRRKRTDILSSIMKLGGDSMDSAYCDFNNEDGSESGGEETTLEDPLKDFYAAFGNGVVTNEAPKSIVSPKEIPVTSRPSITSSSSSIGTPSTVCPSEPRSLSEVSIIPAKRLKTEESHEEEQEDTEVTLFVRSISKTLSGMDARTFALARLEISRVLFDCQFGMENNKQTTKK